MVDVYTYDVCLKIMRIERERLMDDRQGLIQAAETVQRLRLDNESGDTWRFHAQDFLRFGQSFIKSLEPYEGLGSNDAGRCSFRVKTQDIVGCRQRFIIAVQPI